MDEASQEAEAEKTAQEGREHQERKCALLIEAVQLWREKKMEAWILEQVCVCVCVCVCGCV